MNFNLSILKNIGLLLIGGLGLWYLLKKGTASNQLKWNIVGIDAGKKAISVDLINPTNTPLQFAALVADIKANGAPVGIMDYRKPTIIPATGSTRIQIPMKLNPMGVIQFLSAGLKKISTLEFSGTLNAEGLSIPFTEVLNLSKQGA